MNTATRGVILVVVAIALGVLILGQGFDDPSDLVAVVEDQTPAVDQPADEPDTDEPSTDDIIDDESDEISDGETPTPDAGETPGGDDDTDGGPPPILHPPADVRVLVANGTTVSGAATEVNNQLIALGYNGLSPTNTNPVGSATQTFVYYEEGSVLDARQLAEALSAPAESVQPMPDEVPVDSAADAQADILIILGPDLVTG